MINKAKDEVVENLIILLTEHQEYHWAMADILAEWIEKTQKDGIEGFEKFYYEIRRQYEFEFMLENEGLAAEIEKVKRDFEGKEINKN